MCEFLSVHRQYTQVDGINLGLKLHIGKTEKKKKRNGYKKNKGLEHRTTRIMKSLMPGLAFGLFGGLLSTIYYYDLLRPNAATVKNALKMPYDFIIVGAGSAGAVVANRLTENKRFRVLLLEAGSSETLFTELPASAAELQLTDVDWQYKTEPQQYSCFALNDNRSNWARGKVLGGTSSINYMIYTRGNRKDYDHWQSLGNEGWSYNDCLPYFKKSEDNQIPTADDTTYHNRGGYLTISNPPYTTPLLNAFLEAAKLEGYKTRDINGEFQTGVMPVPATIRDGARCSTAKAFLKPAFDRPNLHVLMNAHVVKILFDSNRRAIGVEFDRFGKRYTAKANKEVILSAGTISSPQLLMLSGIGPRKHLEEFNISVVADLPGVGENLQDHISTGGLVWIIDQPISFVRRRALNLINIAIWILRGKGPLTTPGGVESVGFVNTIYANASEDWPDIELHYASGSPVSDDGKYIWPGKGGNKETWDVYYQPFVGRDTYYIMPGIMRPKSKGTIKLRTANPYDHPIIDPKYLSHPDDIKILIAGVKVAYAIGNGEPFKKFGSKFITTILPGCEHVTPYSDDYWECLTRHETITMDHLVGTCKMGPATDPMAVVDNQLRVYGVTGLRVVDASIMPIVPTCNTNAPAIMIAEKIADIIKRQH